MTPKNDYKNTQKNPRFKLAVDFIVGFVIGERIEYIAFIMQDLYKFVIMDTLMNFLGINGHTNMLKKIGVVARNLRKKEKN